MTHDNSPSFESLLAPTSLDAFLSESWRERSLLVRGDPRRTETLITAKEFLRSAGAPGCRVKCAYRDEAGHQKEIWIPGRLAQSLYQSGMTVCVAGVEQNVPQLAAFATACKRDMGYAGKVFFNAYYSPDGSGFNMHFDCMDVIIIQVAGKKHWTYGRRPAFAYPPGNALAENPAPFVAQHPYLPVVPPTPDELEEVTLTPGDILYLPPGTWHQARAVDSSLAVSLTFEELRLARFVSDFLVDRLFEEARGRQTMPVAPFGKDGFQPVPSAVRDALSGMLGDIADLTQSLDLNQLIEHWASSVLGSPSTSVAQSEGAVRPSARLRMADGSRAILGDGVDGGKRSLFTDRGRHTISERLVPVVAKAFEEQEFAAEAAAGWAEEPAHVYAQLKALLDAGLATEVTTQEGTVEFAP